MSVEIAGVPVNDIREVGRQLKQTGIGEGTLENYIIPKMRQLFGDKFDALDHTEFNAAYDIIEDEYLHGQVGGKRKRSQTAKFNRCIKSVRKTVKPRKGSTKESAAIGICVKTVLHRRGRTLKRYSKKRLVTQKRK